MKMKLDKSKADGIAVFQYWHRCPKCGYLYITEYDKFCSGCGEEIEFIPQRLLK